MQLRVDKKPSAVDSLATHGITLQKGVLAVNIADRIQMENFFGLLKSELLYLQNFNSMQHFISELADYIDYYNNCRIKQKLKGMTPALHRLHTLKVA